MMVRSDREEELGTARYGVVQRGGRRPDLRGTRPEWTPARGEVVGRTAGMRGLRWTAREEERRPEEVGTETNSGEVTVVRGGNDEIGRF